MAQNISNNRELIYRHDNLITAYSNFLSQYSTVDEHFDTTEIFKILSKKLANITENELYVHEDNFLKILKSLEQHPRIGKLLLKHFSKNHNLFFDNTFYLISHIMLCSIPRFQSEAVVLFSNSLIKLWNFYEPIDKVSWIKILVKNSIMQSVRERIILTLEVLKNHRVWFPYFALGLQKIALELIQSDTQKNLNIRLTQGRLQETNNQIGFLGRRIFVEVAVLNVQSLDQQLLLLINAVFASSSLSSIAYVLIDVILELTIRAPVLLLNSWKIFEKLIESVCSLSNSEVSTALIRAIMPVINQRAQLRALLLKTMKVHMLSPAKMSFALPIILLLLKSLSDQPEIKQVTQMSQSFATFSTQVLNEIGMGRQSEQAIALEVFGCIKRCINQSAVTKCLIYKGLVEICKKNSCFVVQVIDLLINEAESLPELIAANYVESKRDVDSAIKIPLAHIAMALSSLIRIYITHRDTFSSALTANVADTMTVRAEDSLNKISNMALNNELNALFLGVNADFGTTFQGVMNKAFAHLMIKLYDVLIQHFWIVEMAENEDNEGNNCIIKILNLVQKRLKLFEVLEKKDKTKNTRDRANDDLTQSHAINTISDKKKTKSMSNLGLEANLSDIEKIFTALINKNYDESSDKLKEMRNALIGWTIERIYISVEKLDPFSISTVISMPCFVALAKSLIIFYIGDDISEGLSVFRCWNVLKTYAIISYANIIKYLTVRYQHRCQTALVELLSSINGSTTTSQESQLPLTSNTIMPSNVFAVPTQNQFNFCRPVLPPTQNFENGTNVNLTNYNKNVSRAESITYYRTLFKHFVIYSNQLLPALFSIFTSFQKQKMIVDFQKQANCMLDLCNHVVSLFPNSGTTIQKNSFKIFRKLAKVNLIEDRLVSKELWRIIFNLVSKSDYSEYYIDFLSSLINDICMLTDLPEGAQAGHRSITMRNREDIMNSLLETLSKILSNVAYIFEIKTEMGGTIDDEFLVAICNTTKRILDVSDMVIDFVAERESLVSDTMFLMTQSYQAVYLIAKQLEIEKQAKVDCWKSIKELEELVQGSLSHLLAHYSNSHIGTSHDNDGVGISEESFTKRVRKSKKDEKVFVNHERAFEKMQVELILISKLFNDDQLVLKTIKLNTVRDFAIDSELLQRRLERRDTVSSTQDNAENENVENENLHIQETAINLSNDSENDNDTNNTAIDKEVDNDATMDSTENVENEFGNRSSILPSERSAFGDISLRENILNGAFCDQNESFDTFCREPKKRRMES